MEGSLTLLLGFEDSAISPSDSCLSGATQTFVSRSHDRSQGDTALVSFAPAAVLTKSEVFEACEGLASVERLLLEDGHDEAASWVALLFEDLEDRLSGRGAWSTGRYCFSGSNSSDSELMQ